MITPGINPALHESAAALVRDGELIAAVEVERFTRIKQVKRPLPFTAWELCALYHGEFLAIGR